MKKILKILLFLFILINVLLLQNCKKNTQFFRTRIVGKLTNKITGEPMPNVEIKLLRNYYTMYGASDEEYVKSVYTNDKGEFDYSFHAEKVNEATAGKGKNKADYIYKIKPYIPFNDCVEDFGDIYINDISSNVSGGLRTYKLNEKHKNEVNIKFDSAPAYLKLHIKNQTPFDNNDRVCVFLQRPHFGTCTFLINTGEVCFTGMTIDTIINIKLDKYGWYIAWSYTKNSLTYPNNDTFQISENDTLLYNINY
ncbi:MAG: hypothetical protein PHD97_03940 [Bacteroidales bacterium]|nr:hypothetical protein [Bacteroidales bacterium]